MDVYIRKRLKNPYFTIFYYSFKTSIIQSNPFLNKLAIYFRKSNLQINKWQELNKPQESPLDKKPPENNWHQRQPENPLQPPVESRNPTDSDQEPLP